MNGLRGKSHLGTKLVASPTRPFPMFSPNAEFSVSLWVIILFSVPSFPFAPSSQSWICAFTQSGGIFTAKSNAWTLS
jgi:hypothetical protein